MNSRRRIATPKLGKRYPIGSRKYFGRAENGTYNHYRVVIPGMLFDMLLGTDIPPFQRDHCIVRGHHHPIYLLEDNSLFWLPVARQFTKAVPTSALAQEFLPSAIFNLTKHRFRK